MEENTGRKKSGFAAGLLTGIVIMLMISILGFGGWYIVNRNSSGSYTSENVTEGDVSKKLDKLNKLIDKYYLYQDEVDQDALVEGIYSGYAAALGDESIDGIYQRHIFRCRSNADKRCRYESSDDCECLSGFSG